jgi:hypothetical protein
MPVKLNSAGGGSVTLTTPSTASTYTLTLPAATGTVVYADASNVIAPAGNIQFSASNAGVVFNNSSALTNSTLNDYEAGSWTPTVSATGGSITSYTSSGTYRKIGSFVTLNFVIGITNAGTASGVMVITNLPFATPGLNSAGGVMSENQTNGITGSLVAINTTTIYGKKYDGGNPTVTNYTWIGQISYAGPF